MRQRPQRRNAIRVNLRMAPRIMPLDVVKLRRLLERRMVPVQVAHPLVQTRVAAADVANVALEVLHIHRVEARQRHVQADVRLGDVLAQEVGAVGLRGEVLLSAVEGLEDAEDALFVGLAGGGEAGLVDAVVDAVVCPRVGLFDLALQALRVQRNSAVFLLNQVVKLAKVVSRLFIHRLLYFGV